MPQALPVNRVCYATANHLAARRASSQVVLFAFDCLYLNGESMLHRPLTERREALYGALKEVEGQLAYASAKTSRDVEELAVGARVYTARFSVGARVYTARFSVGARVYTPAFR